MPETAPRRSPSEGSTWKSWGLFLLKAVVTFGLLGWLLSSDTLSLRELSFLVSSPGMALAVFSAWLLIPVGLSTWRWRLLLRACDEEVTVFRGAALQVMALFFNSLVPGNVGGDFLKNHAQVGRDGGKIVALVLVERVLGLVSLIWVTPIGIFFLWDRIAQHASLIQIAVFESALLLGSVVGPWVLLKWIPARRTGDDSAPPSRSFSGKVWGLVKRATISAAETARLFFHAPGQMSAAFFVSLVMHGGNMALFLYVARALGNPEASFGEVAFIFPVGILSLVLPVSFSGMGVGHVLFEELFQLIGLSGGANVFNVYMVGFTAPAVLGAIPYLLLKSSPQKT